MTSPKTYLFGFQDPAIYWFSSICANAVHTNSKRRWRLQNVTVLTWSRRPFHVFTQDAVVTYSQRMVHWVYAQICLHKACCILHAPIIGGSRLHFLSLGAREGCKYESHPAERKEIAIHGIYILMQIEIGIQISLLTLMCSDKQHYTGF